MHTLKRNELLYKELIVETQIKKDGAGHKRQKLQAFETIPETGDMDYDTEAPSRAVMTPLTVQAPFAYRPGTTVGGKHFGQGVSRHQGF
jgi:hypothetical protein